jgi:hypothetical protein
MSQRDLSKLRVEVCIVTEENLDVDPVDVKTLDGKTELEPIVDRDLDAFAKFYETKLKDRLSPFERAAIKTYLYWKTHPEMK